MSSSLPIIAHKEVGAVHDLIIDNLTGFVIEDWMELELKMMEMYSNPSKCEVFSENAEKLMKEHWNY